MSTIFTAAKRRSLERIAGSYLSLSDNESDFTISDAFSLGILLTHATQALERSQKMIDYYKSAYSTLCGALSISNPEIFLIHLSNQEKATPWQDFSDFKAVWYPKWFKNQLALRKGIFNFAKEETQNSNNDFWGSSCSDESVRSELLAVRDSFKQIHIGVLAVVFKIDAALASLLSWNSRTHISWYDLQNKFHFPKYLNVSQ